MSYLVLARKFRPQTFASIIGQEHISRALANSIVRDRVPHAVLLTGPRGVGKTTSARVFAKALNCQRRREITELQTLPPANAREGVEPCGECSNCLEIAKSTSLAVIEIDGASNNSVDNVRELIESLRTLPPAGARYKIYIIDEVHMLSTSAFNALLKSLEEPPPNTVFIFATTDPQKIPETVLSRCQRYDFRRLQTESIVEHLQAITRSEAVSVDPQVLHFIARRAAGGMRDAQSMLDRLFAFAGDSIDLELAENVFGVVGFEQLLQLAEAVLGQEPHRVFEILDHIFSQTIDVRIFAADLVEFWRNVLLLRVSGKRSTPETLRELTRLTEEEFDRLVSVTSELSSFDSQRLFDLAERTSHTAISSQFPRYVFEAGLIKMASLESLKPIAEIVTLLRDGGVTKTGELKASTPVVQARATEPPMEVSKLPFNPSWVDFINFVRSSSEPMLLALLKRVSPLKFTTGQLDLGTSKFDLNLLQDTETISSLKKCLERYSNVTQWKISMTELAAETGKLSELPPGSVSALERKSDEELRDKVEQEARDSSLVQAALATFEGSRINKVSVLK